MATVTEFPDFRAFKISTGKSKFFLEKIENQRKTNGSVEHRNFTSIEHFTYISQSEIKQHNSMNFTEFALDMDVPNRKQT